PLSHTFGNPRTVKRHTFMDIDKTQAIRAAQSQVKAGAEGVELALPLSTLLAELGKSARKNDGGPQTPRGPFLKRRTDLLGGYSDHSAIDRPRQIRETAIGRQSRDLGRAGVHRKDLAGVAEALQIYDDIIAERIWAWRGADDGYRTRLEQR